MKYNVTKNFQDKFTRVYYGSGSVYETDNEERAAELINGGYIQPMEEKEVSSKRTKKASSPDAETEVKTKKASSKGKKE